MATEYNPEKPWRVIRGRREATVRKICCLIIAGELVWLGLGWLAGRGLVETGRQEQAFQVEWSRPGQSHRYGISFRLQEGILEFYEVEEKVTH